MLAIADRLEAELPAVEADVTSTADLTRLLEPTDVVVSTVGPFMQLGIATVTGRHRRGRTTSTPPGRPASSGTSSAWIPSP
jgi:short subunit dehydrogenase-like uncharacterized protein